MKPAGNALVRYLLALTALLLVVTTSCAGSAPRLPASTDPATVSVELSGSDGQETLRQISTFRWDDDGARAAEYFTWIAPDSASEHPPIATRAAETAHVIAVYLADNTPELMSISSGFLGLHHAPLGQVNPKLLSAYAEALTPYQKAMIGTEVVRGFTPLTEPPSDDFSAVRRIYEVMGTDAEAGRRFSQSAYDRATEVASSAATQVCVSGADPETVVPPAIREAGALSGLAASTSPDDQPERATRKTPGRALDDLFYAMASPCVSADVHPLEGRISKFIKAGQLLPPSDVLKVNQGVAEYYSSLRDYLASRGISTAAFYTWYDHAQGRPPVTRS